MTREAQVNSAEPVELAAEWQDGIETVLGRLAAQRRRPLLAREGIMSNLASVQSAELVRKAPVGGPRWEHFAHGADIGVRGYGPSLEEAFE